MAHRACRSVPIGDALSALLDRQIARRRELTPEAASPGGDPASTLLSKAYWALLVIAAVVGVIVSLAAWGFLELITTRRHRA
jgi:hypothetical protein